MIRSRVVVAVLCLAVASSAALASDGVIEINQARADAGGVTPGDTVAGFPVTISVSGSYRLSSNLTIATVNTNVINVTAPDVTIDLNGFTIKGPNSCPGTPAVCVSLGTGTGIEGGTVPGITVRDGTITGMGAAGINLSTFSRVERVHVSHTNFGIYIVGSGIGGNSVVSGCRADQNSSFGITARDRSNLVQDCIATNNGVGIEVIGGQISGCTASGNAGEGFSGGGFLLVTGSTATGNGSFGLITAPGSAYSNCLFKDNNGASAEVSGAVQIGTNICNGAPCP